ncbi:hypothetical protein [uncultured Amnibacterium sp.]|uniref:hypothetical protein n=1 Tax=uncultured Amnibacterium sp. TaxID=1631851 RepID=UPI0035CB636D
MSPTTQARPGRAGRYTMRRLLPIHRVDEHTHMPQSSTEDRSVASEHRLSQRFAEMVESGWSVPGFVVRRPRVAAEVVRDIHALPLLIASLPAGPESEAVRSQMMQHRTSRRAMLGISAVLEVPSEPGRFLEGHERATVRRKIRAATKQGVTVRTVPADERRALLALADHHEQINEREQYRNTRPQNDDLLDYGVWIAAYDAEGEPIALAVTPIAGEWATLRYFRTLRPGQAASDARYFMTQVVADELGARGVRHLVDTARPHWLPNGLRHFQRMVGFRLVRVGPARVAG